MQPGHLRMQRDLGVHESWNVCMPENSVRFGRLGQYSRSQLQNKHGNPYSYCVTRRRKEGTKHGTAFQEKAVGQRQIDLTA